MKLLNTLPFAILASTVSAKGDPMGVPPPVDATPTENFKWANPFTKDASAPAGFDASCTAEWTFFGHEFQLHDLEKEEPLGLKPYAHALKNIFRDLPYPGGWDGMDPHGYERPIVKMDYISLPIPVREYIEEEQRTGGAGKDLFAVYNKIVEKGTKAARTVKPPAKDKEAIAEARKQDVNKLVLFSPGAIYDILPLFVAESSQCTGQLKNLKKYSSTPQDGAVVAWTTSHQTQPRDKDLRGLVFTVKAQVLKAKPGTEKAEEAPPAKSPSASIEEKDGKDEL